MCGIGVFVNCEPDENTINALKRRGPDSFNQQTFSIADQMVTVVATVLLYCCALQEFGFL